MSAQVEDSGNKHVVHDTSVERVRCPFRWEVECWSAFGEPKRIEIVGVRAAAPNLATRD